MEMCCMSSQKKPSKKNLHKVGVTNTIDSHLVILNQIEDESILSNNFPYASPNVKAMK